ncbi:MAG: PAS domain S-box protein [Armatimonadota bacterium]|nr:PAS domain S-box protein [Armatimonadota bacterium]
MAAEGEAARGLTEESARWRKIILDNFTDTVFLADTAFRLLYVNPYGAETIGYSQEELLSGPTGRDALDLYMLKEDHVGFLRAWEKALAGESGREQVRAVRKDGKITWLSVLLTPVKDESGAVVAVQGSVRDIAEQKAVETTRDQLAQYLSDILESSYDGVVAYDKDLHITVWNRAFELITGLPRQEALCKPIDQALPFLSEIGAETTMRAALEAPVALTQDLRYHIPRTGKEGSLQASCFPLKEPSGEAIGGVCIFRDTTEQTKASEALRESEERYRRIFDYAVDGICIVSLTGTILDVNPAFCEMLNYTRDELVGGTAFDLTVPEDWERVSEHLRLISESRGVAFECVELRKDGSLVPIEARGIPFIFGGQPAMLAIIRDISERKKVEDALAASEVRYREFVEDISDWVWEVDLEARYTYASPVVERILGYRPEDVLGRSAFEFIIEEDRERCRAVFEQAISRREEFHGLLNRNRRKDGSILHLETSGSPVCDNAGRLIGYRGVDRDITDRVTAEEEKRHFYRTAISAFTGGKLDIITPEEAEALSKPADLALSMRTPEEAVTARRAVRSLLEEHGLSGEPLESFIVAAGEAINNAIKHAGNGEVFAGTRDKTVWVSVADNGPGIETFMLPRVALEKGYTTKPSLGLGYSIMLDAADKVALYPGPDGVHVILEKNLKPERPGPSPLEMLPDTW